MAAQVDLDGRREPAQVEGAVVAAHQEGRLRDVHLRGDGLHPRLWRCALEDAHARGVPGERSVGERVDLVDDPRHGGAYRRRHGAATRCYDAIRPWPACAIPFVLFDAGDTLLAPRESFGAVYARVLATLGVELAAADLERGLRRCWADTNAAIEPGVGPVRDGPGGESTPTGCVSSRGRSRARPERRGHRRWPARAVAPLREAFRDPASWRVFDDVVPVLAALREAGARLAIVSNWDSGLPALLDRLGLASWFDAIVVSHLEGMEKPRPGAVPAGGRTPARNARRGAARRGRARARRGGRSRRGNRQRDRRPARPAGATAAALPDLSSLPAIARDGGDLALRRGDLQDLAPLGLEGRPEIGLAREQARSPRRRRDGSRRPSASRSPGTSRRSACPCRRTSGRSKPLILQYSAVRVFVASSVIARRGDHVHPGRVALEPVVQLRQRRLAVRAVDRPEDEHVDLVGGEHRREAARRGVVDERRVEIGALLADELRDRVVRR